MLNLFGLSLCNSINLVYRMATIMDVTHMFWPIQTSIMKTFGI
jgi:hypothetical protein